MPYAWIENDLIFVGTPDIAPEDAITVPEGTLPQDLKIENGKIVFKSPQEKAEEERKRIAEQALMLAKEIVNRKLQEYGYYNLGDLKIYADIGVQEAQELFEWYLQFEAKLWSWLGDDLPQMNDGELQKIDITSVIEGFTLE